MSFQLILKLAHIANVKKVKVSKNLSDLGEKRLMIAHFVDPIDSGRQFDTWPLHITLMPWFRMNELAAEEKLEEAARDMRSFQLALGETAVKTLGNIELFGQNIDIPARRIVEPTSLGVMHGRLLGEFYNKLEDVKYVAGNYSPHVTIRENNDPGIGAKIKVDKISLIEYDKPLKTVVRNYNLNDETTT